MLSFLLLPIGATLLGALFAADARDRVTADEQRRAHAALCSGRDCDIAPSA